jgi:hypothetical protein
MSFEAEAEAAELAQLQRNKRHLDDVAIAQARVLQRLASPADSGLVSVRLVLADASEVQLRRAITSVLRQHHAELELLVIGDPAAPAIAGIRATFDDPRVRYHALTDLPALPQAPRHRAASQDGHAAALAHGLARGDWMAWLDARDELAADHLQVLLTAARSAGVAIAYGQTALVAPDGEHRVLEATRFERGRVGRSAVLYHRRLFGVRPDPHAWILDEPVDWHLWRRMARVCGRTAAVSKVLVHQHEPASRALSLPPPAPACVVADARRACPRYFDIP